MKKVVTEALNSRNGTVGYLSQLTEMSRRNRNNQTLAEQIIWNKLLKGKRLRYTFLRQKPINRFIVDFYCSKLNLAIEIDGDSHKGKENYDKERDEFLRQIGIQTVRFTNETVLHNFSEVKQKLFEFIKTNVPLVKGEQEED